ncbi:hypothetical protein CLV51_10763 [Chitinophaga niastensis]|uniref:Dolichyl-phosphate-mannose-protein mannosyltransferase n=1 Tax=Chitinophaga niastensis TaxID=536980 RepID=A0A2P8HBZ4_CHINA|nr:hypothetical protein [Chitinophaga niastensis]PSL43753.1 hypothetical protein CLV51_10763 [Chitinophaga niastensis]
MKLFIQKRYPVFIALLVLALLLFISCQQILLATNDYFCYPLDDTFIHMTIAKNFALNGTWGINPQEFSSASSSPLYTLILAGLFKLSINSMWMPFFVNAFFACLLLITSGKLLRQFNVSPVAQCIILLLIVILTPLTVMIVCGMEHTLHAWLAVLLLYKTIHFLRQDSPDLKTVVITALIAGLAILARFEALFLLAAIVILGIYNKKWLSTFALLVIALIPMVLFGYLSLQQGGYFLPNSVLLKASHIGGGLEQLKNSLQEIVLYKLIYGNNTMMNIFSDQYAPEGASSLSGTVLVRLLIVIPVLLLTLKTDAQKTFSGKLVKQLGCIFIITCFLHLALAAVGWLFRYEAYLVVMGIITGSLLLYPQLINGRAKLFAQSLLERLVLLFLVIFTLAPLPLRAMSAYNNLPKACRNIYEQQHQIGRFLQQSYHHTAIAVNDIGAVSYMSDNRILDMWGLGNNIVATSKLQGHYTSSFLQQFTQKQQIKIAIVYDSWFDSTLLHQWKKVATWKISDNVICGSDEVSFYAIDPAWTGSLADRLKNFSGQLPRDVRVTYFQ